MITCDINDMQHVQKALEAQCFEDTTNVQVVGTEVTVTFYVVPEEWVFADELEFRGVQFQRRK